MMALGNSEKICLTGAIRAVLEAIGKVKKKTRPKAGRTNHAPCIIRACARGPYADGDASNATEQVAST